MNTRLLLRSCGLLSLVALLGHAKAHAQSAEPPAIGIHVNGLTSDERDALSRDLAVQGDVQVGFACVPAGILMLEPTGRAAFTPERQAAAIHVVRARIDGTRISEEQLTRTGAEALCAEARNR